MSLSFVSKSIQTQDQDGDFTETAIEGAENDSSSQERQRPLCDQLRTNKEREDEEREEFQRSMMRGTLALDEDDAAYLGELQRQKTNQAVRQQQETELELAAFHAAKMEQEDAKSVINSTKDEKGSYLGPTVSSVELPIRSRIVAPFIRKKRKLGSDGTDLQSEATTPTQWNSVEGEMNTKETEAGSGGGVSGLEGLLAGYESDSSVDHE